MAPLLAAALFAALSPAACAQAGTDPGTAPGTAPGADKSHPASTPAASPVFDVAAIHQNNSDLSVRSHRSHIYSSPNDGNFRTINVSMKTLLEFAYAIPSTRILGGPSWLNSIYFDIDAKADSSVDGQMQNLSSDAGKLEKQRMVQALLADRFKLDTHLETRELPIYVLAAAKSGPKFLDSQAGGTTINGGHGHIQVEGGDNTVALLAEQLAEQVFQFDFGFCEIGQQLAEALGRPVVDKTGIQGRYKLALEWTPDDRTAPPGGDSASGSPAPDSGPSIFTALEEQLGLKLESQKGPVQVLVVDHVELPTEN